MDFKNFTMTLFEVIIILRRFLRPQTKKLNKEFNICYKNIQTKVKTKTRTDFSKVKNIIKMLSFGVQCSYKENVYSNKNWSYSIFRVWKLPTSSYIFSYLLNYFYQHPFFN